MELVKEFSGGVVAVAERTARHGGVIAGWMTALAVFVGVQGRIDARDPKLALAPLVSEPFVDFDDAVPPTDDTGPSA